jgi:hypothetical protein
MEIDVVSCSVGIRSGTNFAIIPFLPFLTGDQQPGRKNCCYYVAGPPKSISKRAGEAVAAYCVVLRPHSLVNSLRPRNKRFYLSADTAVRAMRTASEDNPEWCVIGVEPGGMFPPMSQGVATASSDGKHAA